MRNWGVAYFNDLPVGNIICRYEPETSGDKVKLYIMTIGVLPAYRRLGLATKLLEHVLEQAGPGKKVTLPAVEKDAKPQEATVSQVYLNVQTSNTAARNLYERHGFQLSETLPTYYREGLEPRSAWVLTLS